MTTGDCLPRDYSFKYLKTTFNCSLEYKFNIVTSKHACGKSYLAKLIAQNPNNGNIINLGNFSNFVDLSKEHDKLFLLDECDIHKFFRSIDLKDFLKSPNQFLIISRDIPHFLPISYKAVFNWIAHKRNYSLERKYPDYDTFITNKSYITEDANSGYQYARSVLKNVRSSASKDNLPKLSLEQTTVIANGADFAKVLPNIKLHDTTKLFLPESFEYLIVKSFPKMRFVMRNSKTSQVLSYNSLEHYYYDKLCILEPSYNKALLGPIFYHSDLYGINKIPKVDTVEEIYYNAIIQNSVGAYLNKHSMSIQDALDLVVDLLPTIYNNLNDVTKIYIGLCLTGTMKSRYFDETLDYIQSTLLV